MFGKSIRRYVILFSCMVLLIIIAGYSLLAFWFMSKGMDSAEVWLLEKEATAFAERYRQNPQTPMPGNEYISSALTFEELPSIAQTYFPPEEHQNKTLLYKEGPDDVYYLFPYDLDGGKRLYLLSHYRDEDISEATEHFVLQTINTLWPVIAISLLLALVAVAYMAHRLIKPIKGLERWANGMTLENMKEPRPGFSYQELNSVAEQLQLAFQRVGHMLAREHRFLRNASHELRTPIAVVSTNIELLQRILQKTELPPNGELPIARIQRAATNMRELTETILWLGREGTESLKNEPVALDMLVSELISDNRYLLQSKAVELITDLQQTQIEVAPTPCRIAISNLLRNAMQYTQEGSISVWVEPSRVCIRNESRSEHCFDKSGSDYGFGLGLVLVEQIAQRMDWQYDNREIPGGRQVEIDFGC